MAIIQISKIQVRSGSLVDLPQLDDAEFGWASDEKKLYIGKTSPNENIEILTSYSNIYFSQVNGSYGNLNVTTPVTGQTLTYNKSSNTWVNTGGNALAPGNPSYYSNTPIHLGNVSNVYIGGGAIGYVLETDGTGNLAWTPKGTISANISDASTTNPVVITTSDDNFFTDGAHVTITNVGGMTQLNGNSYYANVLTSNTFSLYSDSGLTTPVDGSAYGVYTTGGRAIASVGGTGGTGVAGGSTYSVQYNSGGLSTGDANFQWNYGSQLLSLTGTANISQNVNVTGNVAASCLISNIATGTAPLTVTSTTRVANLDVAKSGIANTVNDAAQPNITSTGILTSVSVSGNANIGNIGTGGLITATGNITGGNLKTGGFITSTGNANIGNIGTGGLITATGNITGGNLVTSGVLSVTSNANIGNIGTAGLLTVTGNANIGNIGTAGLITATGNITGGNLVTSGVLSVTSNANIGNIGTAGLITATGNIQSSAFIVGANLSITGNSNVGNLGATNIVGTLTTASQTNITAVGTITNLSVSGNANLGNIYSNVISTGANTTAGNITGNWTLTTGSRLQATYADLAEYYEADQYYEPGTVLQFGGEKEVTIAEDGTSRVAGVISTDPAYVMNSGCKGNAVAIALQGRVPTKVRGTIRKGDLMVSAGNGFARPAVSPTVGTVIGKALENFEGIEGVIEVAVGRL